MNCPELAEEMLNRRVKQQKSNSAQKRGLTEEFINLLSQKWYSQEKVLDTTKFKRALDRVCPSFRGDEQHDAREFMSEFFTALEEEDFCGKQNEFIISRLFGLTLEHITTCFSKKHSFKNEEDTTFLHLNVIKGSPNQASDKNKIKLECIRLRNPNTAIFEEEYKSTEPFYVVAHEIEISNNESATFDEYVSDNSGLKNYAVFVDKTPLKDLNIFIKDKAGKHIKVIELNNFEEEQVKKEINDKNALKKIFNQVKETIATSFVEIPVCLTDLSEEQIKTESLDSLSNNSLFSIKLNKKKSYSATNIYKYVEEIMQFVLESTEFEVFVLFYAKKYYYALTYFELTLFKRLKNVNSVSFGENAVIVVRNSF